MTAPLHEVRVSFSAIRANAEVLADRGFTIADVRADGFGHGLIGSAVAALEGGARRLLVSSDADAAALDAAGITAGTTTDRAVGTSGAALYGLSGGLRAAMRVSAVVVGTKRIAAGEGVSYGYTYRAAEPTTLALVGLGYADGLDRWASNRGTVRLAGAARPIVGRVAMNVHVLELGEDTASPGDEAVVFGEPADGEPSASDWATAIGATPTIVTSVFGSRYVS